MAHVWAEQEAKQAGSRARLYINQPQSLSLSGPLPPAKPHNLPKQNYHMSLWGTFHVQAIAT